MPKVKLFDQHKDGKVGQTVDVSAQESATLRAAGRAIAVKEQKKQKKDDA